MLNMEGTGLHLFNLHFVLSIMLCSVFYPSPLSGGARLAIGCRQNSTWITLQCSPGRIIKILNSTWISGKGSPHCSLPDPPLCIRTVKRDDTSLIPQQGQCDWHRECSVDIRRAHCWTGNNMSAAYFQHIYYTCLLKCWSQFELRLDETSGLSSTCPRVIFLERVSLEECKREACRLKGNVINKRPTVCDIRICTDAKELDYTADKGGWDIYALPEEIKTTSEPPEEIETKSEPPSTTIQLSTMSIVKADVLIPAVLVPLLVILMTAFGVLIYKHRQQSTNHNGQSTNQERNAETRPVTEYGNSASVSRNVQEEAVFP